MHAVAHWTWWALLQIWPNLAASLIWATPAAVWHHRRIRRHVDQLHARIAELAPQPATSSGSEVRDGQDVR